MVARHCVLAGYMQIKKLFDVFSGTAQRCSTIAVDSKNMDYVEEMFWL